MNMLDKYDVCPSPCDFVKRLINILYAPDGAELITLDRLRELVEADRDGRVTIWGYAEGTTFWVVNVDTDFTIQEARLVLPDTLECYYDQYANREEQWLMLDFRKEYVGETYFLTRAEAEAALKGESHDNTQTKT